MMLGGAPGGTAGGIKITAFLTLILYARSEILGLPNTNFMSHTIDILTIRKAFATFSVFLMVFLAGLFAIAVTDADKPLIFLMFEVMSALATVGVTANLTPTLSMAGQAIIMALMFFWSYWTTIYLSQSFQSKNFEKRRIKICQIIYVSLIGEKNVNLHYRNFRSRRFRDYHC